MGGNPRGRQNEHYRKLEKLREQEDCNLFAKGSMNMRTKRPEQLKLDIRWSSERWTPRISFVSAPRQTARRSCQPGSETAGASAPASAEALFGKKPLRRRQSTMLWVRDGSRSMWR